MSVFIKVFARRESTVFSTALLVCPAKNGNMVRYMSFLIRNIIARPETDHLKHSFNVPGRSCSSCWRVVAHHTGGTGRQKSKRNEKRLK